ncbi:hypothetical protein AU195_18255 [Mycobacterium sp. IS-1496]|nr:hypothetical protein AU195_18255 [Mycobacterium sp. IS-1496]
MTRRGQQAKRELRRAQREVGEQLQSDHGAYEPPPRDDCVLRDWETPYDDANTVRIQFLLWKQGGVLVDFVVNVQELASEGWTTVEHFDCCHGHCHLHPQSGVEPESITRLDEVADVQRAFSAVAHEADERARIIRGKGG